MGRYSTLLVAGGAVDVPRGERGVQWRCVLSRTRTTGSGPLLGLTDMRRMMLFLCHQGRICAAKAWFSSAFTLYVERLWLACRAG